MILQSIMASHNWRWATPRRHELCGTPTYADMLWRRKQNLQVTSLGDARVTIRPAFHGHVDSFLGRCPSVRAVFQKKKNRLFVRYFLSVDTGQRLQTTCIAFTV